MDTLLKIMMIAVIASVLALLLKKEVPELALLLVLISAAVILFCTLPLLNSVKDFLNRLTDLSGISPAVIAPLIKALAISIVCRLAADICRDASQNALASAVELAGAVTTVCISLPLIQTALGMILALV